MAKTTKAEKATMDEITSTEEFKKFIAMLEVTAQLDTPFDELPTDDQRDIVNKFYLWQDKGSPKAEMPKIKDDKEDEILSLYRTKHRGDQYIWYVTRDSRTIGKEWIHTYAKVEDYENGKPLGTYHDDTNTIIESKPKYTIPYTKELGEKLLNLAFKHNDQPIFVFEMGGKRVGVVDPEVMFNCDSKQMGLEVQRVLLSRKPRG